AGAPTFGIATLGAACDEEGAFACGDASTTLVLSCSVGTWTLDSRCDDDKRCNPAAPGCAALDAECLQVAHDGPTCDGSDVFDCSPGRYTELHLSCPFGCANGACVPGSDGALTLHTGVVTPQARRWDGPIPVCFAPPAAGATDTTALRDEVRSEVDAAWSRYLSVPFVGFGPCEDGATGVVVSFPAGCDGHLVNDVGIGTSGDFTVAIPLEICASYVPPGADQAVPTDEPLARLLARHQFGHVLGLIDGDDSRKTVMVRGVDPAHAGDIVPTLLDYEALEHPADPPDVPTFEYLGKPALSLVTPAGDCVAAPSLAAGASLEVGPCGSNAGASWSAPMLRLAAWASAPESCTDQPTAGAAVTLEQCAPARSASQFYMPSVKWRSPTACVAAESSAPAAGTGLVMSPCTDAGDATQAWYFEVLSTVAAPTDASLGDQAQFVARIHLVAADLCVTLANVPSRGQTELELDTCSSGSASDDPELFTLERDFPWPGAKQTVGTIVAHDGSFVAWPTDGGNVDSDQVAANSAWFLSGPLVNDDGLAMTLHDDGSVSAEALTGTPAASQLFDFYF
ncbi:MAG TPA: hypothetical protein VMI54_21490, partial [Polyangiaceae bacterium]|nr:hypothetical protein [Polyangiaceae bacterium]